MAGEALRMQVNFLYNQPLGVVVLLLAALFVAAALLGRTIGRLLKGSSHASEDSASNFIPTTILGLMALVVSFTFSMAVSRYDDRTNLVVQEANAIGTSLLRAEHLPSEAGAAIKSLLKSYLEVRIDFHNIQADRQKAHDNKIRTETFQNQIWNTLHQVAKKSRDPITALNIAAMNEVFDLGTTRYYSTTNKIPELVYLLLAIIGTIGIGSLGFLESNRKNSSFFNIGVLSVLFALVVGLILDIDRPQRGLIQIDQAPLIDLRESYK